MRRVEACRSALAWLVRLSKSRWWMPQPPFRLSAARLARVPRPAPALRSPFAQTRRRLLCHPHKRALALPSASWQTPGQNKAAGRCGVSPRAGSCSDSQPQCAHRGPPAVNSQLLQELPTPAPELSISAAWDVRCQALKETLIDCRRERLRGCAVTLHRVAYRRRFVAATHAGFQTARCGNQAFRQSGWGVLANSQKRRLLRFGWKAANSF